MSGKTIIRPAGDPRILINADHVVTIELEELPDASRRAGDERFTITAELRRAPTEGFDEEGVAIGAYVPLVGIVPRTVARSLMAAIANRLARGANVIDVGDLERGFRHALPEDTRPTDRGRALIGEAKGRLTPAGRAELEELVAGTGLELKPLPETTGPATLVTDFLNPGEAVLISRDARGNVIDARTLFTKE